MRHARSILLVSALLPALASAGKPAHFLKQAEEGKELYATFHTTLGDFTARLFTKDAPKTVQNFVALATGEKDWIDPATGAPKKNTPLYDGTLFHRVIPGFMIQGGDPLGKGYGGPGYKFEDEFQSGRRFDKPGLLAMANAGPNTNGSQFFVTVSTPHHLDNHHTIFGEVVTGYDVVEKISTVQTAGADRPVVDVVLKHVELSEKPPKGVKKDEKAEEKAEKKGEKAEEKAEKKAEKKSAKHEPHEGEVTDGGKLWVK